MKVLLQRKQLRAYQRYMRNRVVDEDEVMLCADMGLGKTVSVLTAIADLFDQRDIRRVLIVAPKLVAETVWPDEIGKWAHTKHLTFEVLTGDDDRRSRRAEERSHIHIINRENIPWLWTYWGREWPYDMVVLDESSSFKNPSKTNKPTDTETRKALAAVDKTLPHRVSDYDRAKAHKRAADELENRPSRFGALCRARKYIDRVVELSGTPAPNGLNDLWAQAYLLDRGERLGADFSSFKKRFFEKAHTGYGLVPKDHAFKEILRLLEDVMVALRKEDYITMPKAIFNNVMAPLPKKAMDEYRKFKRTLVSEMYEVTAKREAELCNKLLQFANGSMYQTDRTAVPIHKAKLEALDHIVEASGGQPILVGYAYQFDKDAILKRYPRARLISEKSVDARETVDEWNEGKIEMLVGHPASCGHGLNLQFGGHIQAWYGIPWNLEHYLQMNTRLDRPGQEHPVVINHIVAPGTMDERVLQALARKERTQDDVLNHCRIRPEDLDCE